MRHLEGWPATTVVEVEGRAGRQGGAAGGGVRRLGQDMLGASVRRKKEGRKKMNSADLFWALG